jgi:tetratricopeptide (TPR) repeat protein
VKRVVLAVVIIILVLPEIPRYAGERRLRMIEATMAAIVTRARDPQPYLRRLSEDAEATRTYPGDWRPLVAAGRASYLAGDYAQSAVLFERASALGERPEIDVNLGLALLRRGETRRAEELFARAVALSPKLAEEIDRLRGIN